MFSLEALDFGKRGLNPQVQNILLFKRFLENLTN